MKRVLVIEDNRDIAALVAIHLKDLAVNVDHAYDGIAGLRRAREKSYDLIILDLMLPGIEGLEVCRLLREDHNTTPILMLTAKSTERDRVRGLEIGADDYLTKPFGVLELVARVKAIFRRMALMGTPTDTEDICTVGNLVINRNRRRAELAGKCIDLTAREFDLLACFARHPGQVFTRPQLLDRVWGHGHDGYEHTVNSHINRLRAKIEDNPSDPQYLLTVWGVGYKFADPAEQAIKARG